MRLEKVMQDTSAASMLVLRVVPSKMPGIMLCAQALDGGVSAAASAGNAEPSHEDVTTSPKTRIKALMKDGSWAATVSLPHPSSTGQCSHRSGYQVMQTACRTGARARRQHVWWNNWQVH